MNLNPSPVLKISNENLNGISIQERNLLGKINLRGKSSDKEFMKNVGSVLDLVLPIEPNVRVSNNNISIIWLSPNEWLIETPKAETKKVLTLLKSTLNPQKTSITDVSYNRTVLRLEGDHVFTLLSKYLVINLEEVLKTNYNVAQTIFIKIPILLIRNNSNNETISIDIHLNRSHAKYVYELLIDGCKILNI
jgi:sarcosine oxidase subunit gamma|tara:strand:- start:469 stop:1044 length:576 start_codon:yes stop_codon:yes gene_type:complete